MNFFRHGIANLRQADPLDKAALRHPIFLIVQQVKLQACLEAVPVPQQHAHQQSLQHLQSHFFFLCPSSLCLSGVDDLIADEPGEFERKDGLAVFGRTFFLHRVCGRFYYGGKFLKIRALPISTYGHGITSRTLHFYRWVQSRKQSWLVGL